MDIAIWIAIPLLFLGGCIAAVVFAARRYGWQPVLLYVLSAILIRVLIQVFMSDAGQAQSIAIPILGAAMVVWVWPHIVRHRMLDRTQEVEPDQQDEGDK